VNDWPIKEYLKSHFNNQWYYQKNPYCSSPHHSSDRYKDLPYDDWFNFGSDIDKACDGHEEGNDGKCNEDSKGDEKGEGENVDVDVDVDEKEEDENGEDEEDEDEDGEDEEEDSEDEEDNE